MEAKDDETASQATIKHSVESSKLSWDSKHNLTDASQNEINEFWQRYKAACGCVGPEVPYWDVWQHVRLEARLNHPR